MTDSTNDRLFTKHHEWIRVGDGTCQMGITSFAVEQLGDITMVELPEVGNTYEKEEILGSVESVKAVSDLFSPVSGTIARINEELEDTPETINEDPYAGGWLVELTISDQSELDVLMNEEAYQQFCAAES